MNKIIVIGNVGRDPEMRYTPNGQGLTAFSVASNRRYRTADGDQREETIWFNVQAWGRQAEICNQLLQKGDQVYIEGRLSTRLYHTADGQARIFQRHQPAGDAVGGFPQQPGQLPAQRRPPVRPQPRRNHRLHGPQPTYGYP